MFNSISRRRPKLNKFNLAHEVKLSCQMGKLVPILLNEVVPGDRFRCNSEIMMRFAPMIAPVMHRVNVWTHYFFVPNRIVWSEWEDFITGGADGTAAPVHPHFRSQDIFTQGQGQNGDLTDYMGIPEIVDNQENINFNSLPFRAYTQIYNEYYRDQTLQTAIPVPLTSGAEVAFDTLILRNRCWEKDYFTSALPWAQRGDPISVPLDIEYLDISKAYDSVDNALGDLIAQTSGRVDVSSPPGGSSASMRVENLATDLGIDINDLRRSTALQRWLETAARGGSRYVEQLLSFFGVKSSDQRLQRPEYLGGGRQNVMISEVLQTGETGTTPQGTMAGHGVSVGSTNRFQSRFEEHGYVIGIMSVLPKTAYQEGVHRHWSRDDKFDYYWPQFAHLGEQEVLEKEVWYTGASSNTPDQTWGYQSRYAEYKYQQSRVHGDFKDSLDYWHMGRIFDTTVPQLNSSFVQSNPTQRIFANTDPNDHKLWVQIYNNLQALRPMPYHADPRL